MRIEVLLNTRAPAFGDLQRDLVTEIDALESDQVRISRDRVPPPAGTLVLDEVVRFVIEHPDATVTAGAALLNAVVEIASAVMNRRQPNRQDAKTKEDQPTVVIISGESRLALPASREKERKFLRPPSKAKGSTKSKSKGASRPAGKKRQGSRRR
jgi:hypothetical protein